MRAVAFVALLALPGLALADESVAGKWKADLGSDVSIVMDVSPDTHWSSQTLKNDEPIAEMEGTYKQTRKSDTSGNLTFTPTESKVTSKHGAPKVEHDAYTLSNNGQVLRLKSNGDTMVFHKQ